MFLFSSSPAIQWMFFSWKEGRGDFLYQRNWYSWKNRPVCTQALLQVWAAAGSSRFFFSSGWPVWDGQACCGCDDGRSQTLWSLTSYTVVSIWLHCAASQLHPCRRNSCSLSGEWWKREPGWAGDLRWSAGNCCSHEWKYSWQIQLAPPMNCRVVSSSAAHSVAVLPFHEVIVTVVVSTLLFTACSGFSECDLTGKTHKYNITQTFKSHLWSFPKTPLHNHYGNCLQKSKKCLL